MQPRPPAYKADALTAELLSYSHPLKVEAQETGQRHRFSSGVKFPSSPFGHFCFTPPGLLGVIPGAFNHSATISRAAIGRDSNPRSKIRLYGKSKHPKATGLRWMFFDSEYCYLPFNLKLGASDGTRIHNLVHGKDAL